MISIKTQFFLALVLLEPKIVTTETVLKCHIMQFRGYIKTTRKRFSFKNHIHSINFTLIEKDLLMSH